MSSALAILRLLGAAARESRSKAWDCMGGHLPVAKAACRLDQPETLYQACQF